MKYANHTLDPWLWLFIAIILYVLLIYTTYKGGMYEKACNNVGYEEYRKDMTQHYCVNPTLEAVPVLFDCDKKSCVAIPIQHLDED